MLETSPPPVVIVKTNLRNYSSFTTRGVSSYKEIKGEAVAVEVLGEAAFAPVSEAPPACAHLSFACFLTCICIAVETQKPLEAGV